MGSVERHQFALSFVQLIGLGPYGQYPWLRYNVVTGFGIGFGDASIGDGVADVACADTEAAHAYAYSATFMP